MKTIAIKIPEPLDTKLRAAARRRRRSKGTLIRDVLEQHFRAERQTVAGVSCYELTRDLCGMCEGPPDLSYNKKYMKGFGL
jgi:hypothetical protein